MASKRTSRSRGGTVTVRYEGLKELQRAMEVLPTHLYREVSQEIEEIGKGVAAAARENATDQGLIRTHRLVDGIFSDAKGLTLIVGDTAHNPRDGYPYPGRFEYGDLNKPFLQPAMADAEAGALRRLREALDRALRKAF